jgi:putative acetyltransferase
VGEPCWGAHAHRLGAARHCINTDIGAPWFYGMEWRRPKRGSTGLEQHHPNVDPMNINHRPAMLDDANRLFELRRNSIIALAVTAMSTANADSWAARLTLAGMRQKLRELEVWVAEAGGAVAGWGAIRGDRLEGLYTDPQLANRGIGTGLLRLLEALTRERGFSVMHAQASANALQFYLQRGYEPCGPQTADGAQPIAKRLHSLDPVG